MLRRGSSGRRGLAIGVVVALLASGPALVAPVTAGAAGGASSLTTSSSSPLGGGITVPDSSPSASPTSTAANTTTSDGGGISTGSAIGIAIAAFVIIIGIAAAIFRDARRRTRNRPAPRADAARVPGSQRPPKARKLSPGERRRRKRGRAPRRR